MPLEISPNDNCGNKIKKLYENRQLFYFNLLSTRGGT